MPCFISGSPKRRYWVSFPRLNLIEPDRVHAKRTVCEPGGAPLPVDLPRWIVHHVEVELTLACAQPQSDGHHIRRG